MPDDNTVVLENVQLIYRNFSGRETDYNQKGRRNFGVLLSDEMAEGLSRDGWNVKTTKERELDEGETTGGEPWLPVTIRFDGRPPTAVMITSRGRTALDEDLVALLDSAEIVSVDLIVRPYDWNLKTGASGRKAYVKSIYVTIHEDELALKYADVPVAGSGTNRPDFSDDE